MKKLLIFSLSLIFLITAIVGGKGKVRQLPSNYVSDKSNLKKRLYTLKIERNKMSSFSVKRKHVYYNPKSQLRRAVYNVYVFDKRDFYKNIGNPNSFSPKVVKVQVLRRERKNSGCPDPRLQCPSGGFTKYYIYVKTFIDPGKSNVTEMNKIITLDIVNNRFNELKKKGTALYYSVNASGRKTAVFKTYIFSHKHFLELVGDPSKIKSKKVKIKIYRKTVKNSGCPDPRLQCPSGGFTHIYYNCIIL